MTIKAGTFTVLCSEQQRVIINIPEPKLAEMINDTIFNSIGLVVFSIDIISRSFKNYTIDDYNDISAALYQKLAARTASTDNAQETIKLLKDGTDDFYFNQPNSYLTPLQIARLLQRILYHSVQLGKSADSLKKVIFHKHIPDNNKDFDLFNGHATAIFTKTQPRNGKPDADLIKILHDGTTNISGEQLAALINSCLGLIGETAEFTELLTKVLYRGEKDIDLVKATKELGDITWYIARACTALKISLTNVFTGNIQKLFDRYKRGFSSEASINRKDK